MQAEFWHQRWAKQEIGFHEAEVNGLLKHYLATFQLPAAAHIFVPLCGKTLDIHWLLAQGYRVTGAELSESAVKALFDELEVEATVSEQGALKRYQHDKLCVWVGDIFELSKEEVSSIDAIYDRAALVALPEAMRKRYGQHLIDLTDSAPQLLITYEYDQAQMAGPPFSIVEDHVTRLYQTQYRIHQLERQEEPHRLKGLVDAYECAWCLQPLS